MTRLYVLIFILSMTVGAGIAAFQKFTLVQTLISLTVAGFAGSSIIAGLFTYAWFFGNTTDPGSQPRPGHEADTGERKQISQ